MKTIFKMLPLLCLGTAYAATDVDVYHGFASGNPELATEYGVSRASAGAFEDFSFDTFVYHGLQADNPELGFDQVHGMTSVATQPSIGDSMAAGGATRFSDHGIYRGFEKGNPDL